MPAQPPSEQEEPESRTRSVPYGGAGVSRRHEPPGSTAQPIREPDHHEGGPERSKSGQREDRVPKDPARRTAILRTFSTSSEPGGDGMVDDLRRRDLV